MQELDNDQFDKIVKATLSLMFDCIAAARKRLPEKQELDFGGSILLSFAPSFISNFVRVEDREAAVADVIETLQKYKKDKMESGEWNG